LYFQHSLLFENFQFVIKIKISLFIKKKAKLGLIIIIPTP